MVLPRRQRYEVRWRFSIQDMLAFVKLYVLGSAPHGSAALQSIIEVVDQHAENSQFCQLNSTYYGHEIYVKIMRNIGMG